MFLITLVFLIHQLFKYQSSPDAHFRFFFLIQQIFVIGFKKYLVFSMIS